MNETFINIIIDHNQALSESLSSIIGNRYRKAISEEFNPELLMPGKVSYTQKVRDDIRAIKDIIKPENIKCVNTCKEPAQKINPIGMAIPRKVCKDPEEIKGDYKDAQVILHDKYDKCVQEGGEGFIKFVDTLATPKERAENYKIPQFSSVYTSFLVDKEVEKVSKDHVMESFQLIGDIDSRLGKLVEEADLICEEYNKKLCLFSQKEAVMGFEQSLERIAEAVMIIEEDFMNAECLESCKMALLENVKNAHKVLYCLSTHNPRDIKESAIKTQINSFLVEEIFNDSLNNPKEEVKITNEAGEKIKAQLVTSNDRFLKKYKDKALKSNCTGIFINDWREPISIDSKFRQAADIVSSQLGIKRIVKLDVDELRDLSTAASNLNKSIYASSLHIRKEFDVPSPLKKVLELIPCTTLLFDQKYMFKISKTHQINKSDVKTAIDILNDVSADIDHLNKDIMDTSRLPLKMFNVNGLNGTKRERLMKKINSVREHILYNINSLASQYKLKQLTTMQSQSRAVILKACRTSNEAVKEEVNILKEDMEIFSKLI